jgi:hypothetical protein
MSTRTMPYEKILMQQIARLTAEKENLDFQNREYQEIVAELNERLTKQQQELLDTKKLLKELTIKLERLSEI